MDRIRILLADDHDLVRESLRNILAAHTPWEIVGEAVNGREAVELAARLRPDVVVMDVSMPELDGLDAVREIVERAPESAILILTMHTSAHLMRDLLEAGARGYLLKSEARERLLPAIKAVMEHELGSSPAVEYDRSPSKQTPGRVP